ncbi:MAG TPA: toast rack family protein [Anaerolineae bacterium]
MKLFNILTGFILASTLTACNISVNQVTAGSLQSYRVDVSKPVDTQRTTEMQLDVGSASTIIGVGGNGLLNGTVETNVADWKPLVVTADNRVHIRQTEFNGIPPFNSQNDWHVKIGQGIPVSLTINAGAIKGEWELGGVSLRSIDWKQGAADTTVRFSERNPVTMAWFNVDTGASTFKLLGLANTNTDKMHISMGAGALNLRFDGALTRNMTVTIEGGAAAVTVDSGGNQVEVLVGQSLSTVNRGDWAQDADTYQSPEWVKGPQPKITVMTKLAASSLSLVNGH